MLFYRMGDFYELFFEDATIAAVALEIALTKRGKHNDQDIPMCGVPAHAYEYYLEKLIKAGFKVAICEQLETPEEARKRGNKAVVKREVVRIVTPGTIFEESLLESKQTNYLCSIAQIGDVISIAWIDISTGEFNVCTTDHISLQSDLARLRAIEIIIGERLYGDEKIHQMLFEYRKNISVRANNIFDFNRCENRIKQFFKLSTLEGLHDFNKAEVVAAGSLLEYIEHTQKLALPKLNRPHKICSQHFMQIDSYTRKNLEIDRDTRGDRKNSLLSTIDKTLTAAGARLLNTYLLAPLRDVVSINRRLDNVSCFYVQGELRTKLRESLRLFPDIERALSRIFIQKGSPRDLGLIRDGLSTGLVISEHLIFASSSVSEEIKQNTYLLGNFGNLLDELKKALRLELPFNAKDGDFIKEGYNAKLDELRSLKGKVHYKISELKEKYQALTGIVNLKITHNNVLGYYVEITPSHVKKIADPIFIHRQTLGNSIRFTTEELAALETDIISSEERFRGLEMELFRSLIGLVSSYADQITLISQSIAMIDASSALAEIALEMGYVRPIIDHSMKFEIVGGRHPVVEKALKIKFIPNNCDLGEDSNIWLITGPNMAGKSTFLRQNALICLLAQIGSFVPATKAHIGVVDKLFSRIGAGDDISRGYSTFLLEMMETSSILNNATNRSLVILDELGRGTSTHDGLSIAWAVIENIHDTIRARTLFSTHYHELTELDRTLNCLKCHTMKIADWEDKVIFMHEVIAGKSNSSYGIHVAKLAGVPPDVILRANSISSSLQAKHKTSPVSAVDTILRSIDFDALTPGKALDILCELKESLS